MGVFPETLVKLLGFCALRVVVSVRKVNSYRLGSTRCKVLRVFGRCAQKVPLKCFDDPPLGLRATVFQRLGAQRLYGEPLNVFAGESVRMELFNFCLRSFFGQELRKKVFGVRVCRAAKPRFGLSFEQKRCVKWPWKHCKTR